MHYRNGREAHNGDPCVKLADKYTPCIGLVGNGVTSVRIEAVGILFDAVSGNDHCNGSIAPTIGGTVVGACLCDMLHADDLSAILTEKGLNKRPAGK